MKYALKGHELNTAVQEMLIVLLPYESHERVELAGPPGDFALSQVDLQANRVCARALVCRGGVETEGEHIAQLTGGQVERKRIMTHAVRLALYHAMLPHLERPPVWGAMTGVKPAKPIHQVFSGCWDEKAADALLRDHYLVSDSRRPLCIQAAKAALDCERELLPGEIQLYVGIPFCPAKCAYCSFVSDDTRKSGHLVAPYLEALLREIELTGKLVKRAGLRLGSVYIGGGTPTILTHRQLDQLLDAVRQAFDLSTCREFTVEAGRPDTITQDKLTVLASHQVDRISVNPQTMNDQVLAGVGRQHRAADILEAYRLVRGAGSFIVNMDLIAGLPGDTDQGLLHSVQACIALNPENITLHALARKKGAALRFVPQEDLQPDAMDACYRALEAAGYRPYYLYRQKYSAGGLENVGFCLPGTQSHYNICMMEELTDVIALGAGGVTKLCAHHGRQIARTANPKYPTEYIRDQAHVLEEKERIFCEFGGFPQTAVDADSIRSKR